jgi:hypothetical protein
LRSNATTFLPLRSLLISVLCVSAFSFLPSRNPLQYFHEPHVHPIPPRPRNLPLPPRSPQNLPLPPPKTASRLRQHPHRPSRIDLPLEGKNRNRPRTSPPDQDHCPPPELPRKGSPPSPLLQNPRIPSPSNLQRLPTLPPLALRLLQTIMADPEVGHSRLFSVLCALSLRPLCEPLPLSLPLYFITSFSHT